MSSDRELRAALLDWQQAKLKELARKVIFRLSRIPASGIFPECEYNSIWGEYSHHVQYGYFDQVSDSFDDMAAVFCEAVAGTVPAHEVKLFDQLAAIYGEEKGMTGNTYLIEELKKAIQEHASKRDLERYAEGYRWYEKL